MQVFRKPPEGLFKKARSPVRSRFGGASSSKAAGSEEAEAYKKVR
jgi:hypothetical protein